MSTRNIPLNYSVQLTSDSVERGMVEVPDHFFFVWLCHCVCFPVSLLSFFSLSPVSFSERKPFFDSRPRLAIKLPCFGAFFH